MTTANIRFVCVDVAQSATLTSAATQNLALRSQELDHVFWSGAATVTANSAADPAGATTADTVTDSSAAATQDRNQALTVANNSATYTTSVYVKKTSGGTAPTFQLSLALSGGTGVTSTVALNTDTGATSVVGTARVSDEGGWWRLSATVTNNTSGNTTLTWSLRPAIAAYGGFTSVVTATGAAVLAWVQTEANDLPTGYVPTTSGAASGGDFATTLPVGNLQLEGRVRVARTTNAVGAKFVRGDLAAVSLVNAFVLYDHNLSSTSAWRLELFDGLGQSGTRLYDSGAIAAVPGLGWGDFAWGAAPWGGSSAVPGMRSYLTLWFAGVNALSFRLTLIDPNNASGYIQAKRLLLGSSFEPAVNVDYGLSLAWVETSTQRRTQGGSLRTDVQTKFRRLTGTLGHLNALERTGYMDALRTAGLQSEIFVSVFPTQGGSIERDFSMLGKFASLAPISTPFNDLYSTTFTIEEV